MKASNKTDKSLIRSLEASGFFSDFEGNDILHCVIVRSPSPYGRVNKIVLNDIPDGYYFFTTKDIPGVKSINISNSYLKIFANKTLSYIGEPLGIIFGPDEKIVEKLKKSVSIVLDVENLESALKNVIKKDINPSDDFIDFVEKINEMPSLNEVIDKVHIEENTNKNEIVAQKIVKFGLYKTLSEEEADKILFSSDKKILQDNWKMNYTLPYWQETCGAYANYDGKKLHVYSPSRWTIFLHNSLCSVLGLDFENVIVHKTKSSDFYPSGLWRTTQIAIQVALAAFLTKKKVKLVFSQKEQDLFMLPGVDCDFSYKTIIDENGKINSMKINIDIDIGVSNPFIEEIVERITISSMNYYQIENFLINTTAHKSSNPPTSVCIQKVDSQAFFAIENEIQKIALDTGFLPSEIRQVNSKLNSKLNFPFELNLDFNQVLENSLKNSDFNRKYASFIMEAKNRINTENKSFFALPLRGIGLATSYNSSKYNGSSFFVSDFKIEVILNSNDTVEIHAICSSNAIQEIWKKTVSEVLQIPKEKVFINSQFLITEFPTAPEDSFSSIGIINELIKKCCIDIQKKRFFEPLPISSKKSIAKNSKKWNKNEFCGEPFLSSSIISTIVEIELDTYVFNQKIKGIWVTVDCGEVIEENAIKNNIRLEIQQELSMLVTGKSIFCDNIQITILKSNRKSGQISGLIHNSLPSAFSSALSLALMTQLTQIPVSEENLFKIIKSRTKKNSKTEEQNENSSNNK